MLKNIKNIITPIQQWLLNNSLCVGCGMPLSKAKDVVSKNSEKKVTCKCGRIYILDSKNKKYRRALTNEV